MQRVMCLYRVSSKGQLDAQNDDIPVQEKACREFIAKHDDWEYFDKREEKGVSAYKKSAFKREVILELLDLAEKNAFDILLLFMSDRLGRRGPETNYVLQLFIECGVHVWSLNEGELKLDTAGDEIMSSVRFSQAREESKKTSIRVTAAHTQMIEDGRWRGGKYPYGYKLVYNGRVGKKGRMLYDLAIDEKESAIVREVFDLLTVGGYGTQVIANMLNERYPDPDKIWTKQTVLTMLRNLAYTGRLHMKVKQTGEVYTSEPNESLRLISDSQFEFADQIIKSRITTRRRSGNFPEGVTKVSEFGASLLTGILYCAHCGHKLVGNYTAKKRGSSTTYRPIYRCYNGATTAKNCDGQQTYTARKIENAVLSDVRQYFSTISDAVDDEWKTQARKRIRSNALARQKAAEARLLKLQKDQKGLKSEIMKSINGESAFDTDLLKEMLDENKTAQMEAEKEIAFFQDEVSKEEKQIAWMNTQYKEIRDWAAQFDAASLDTKKMILARLIEKITVDRDYNIEIFYYVTVEDFNGEACITAS